MKKADDFSFGEKLIITGLSRMVEEEGMTPHEAFEALEDIKQQTYFALMELHKEYKESGKTT